MLGCVPLVGDETMSVRSIELGRANALGRSSTSVEPWGVNEILPCWTTNEKVQGKFACGFIYSSSLKRSLRLGRKISLLYATDPMR